MKTIKQRTAGRIAVLLIAAMSLGGCGSASKEEAAVKEESIVTVSTQRVETGTITLTNSFIGTISPEETVIVIPLAQGTVTETFFEVGDTVQAGDILFKIDDKNAKLTLKQAQIGVQSAKQSADSARSKLADQQESSALQLESSRLQAQSSYEQAQIGYVMSKNAYEELDNKYNDLKKKVDTQRQIVNVSPNDLTANELLAKLETSLDALKASRDQANQAFLTTRSAYNAAEKGKELTDKSEAVTKEQLQGTIEETEASLQTAISQASLGVEQAQMALSYYTVKAPVSGVIESKNVSVNGMATPSSPAYTIVNNHMMTVMFQVSEAVKNTLSIGQEITIERNNDTYTASITEIGASLNPQSGLFQVKACVAADGTKLPNGVSVKVNADTYRAENTMIIPYEAVYYENEGAYVYISENGRAVKKPITTGIFDDDNIVVTSGLNLGDILVTSWAPQLTEGVLLHAAETKDAESREAE